MRKPRSFPDAETVVQDLKSVTPLIYEAADVGTEEVREFFASRGVPINVHLAPAIFRWAAKEYLLRAGRDVREELVEPGEADDGDKTDEDFRLGDLSQNGLLLTHEPYRIRILKLDPRSDAPGLPPPGNSAAK